MAIELTEYEFVTQGRPHRYDWKSWANGKTWKLTKGTDFTVSAQGMRGNIYSYAKANNLKARTSITDGGTSVIVLMSQSDGVKRNTKTVKTV